MRTERADQKSCAIRLFHTVEQLKPILSVLLYATILSPFVPIIVLAFLSKWMTPDGSAQSCGKEPAAPVSTVKSLELTCVV
jgi:hypothetical protein